MYYSDSGELRQRTTLRIFGRPVTVSWEGGFPGSPRLFDLCEGTVGVYAQDEDFDADRVGPPLVRDEAAPGGMLRLNVEGSGPLKLIACVLLPKNCVVWPASQPTFWPPTDVVKHADTGRMSMVFIGEGSVRLSLQITEDADEWQRLDPDQVRRPAGVGEEHQFAVDRQVDGDVRYAMVPPPSSHVRVFVSSTYEDLKPYRVAVKEAIVRLEHIPRGMEYFGSKPGSPKDECLASVRSCEVYIGVFAMRYGSVDEQTGKSMTHLEYEEALSLGIPTLIYLMDEQKQPVLSDHFDTGENAENLRRLKEELKQRSTVSFFTTPDDLARRVSQDLPPVVASLCPKVEKPGCDGGQEPRGVPLPSESPLEVSGIPGADSET